MQAACLCCMSVLFTQSGVRDTVHLQYKIIFKEDVAHDGEEINQDKSQHSSEDDGATVSCHTFNHIQQCFLSVHQVKQLEHTIHSTQVTHSNA